MDLYADLPLAKGAKASSALDADGKPKTSLSSTSSVWASTPLMVPQAAKNKANNRLPAVTTSNTSMLPAALAAGRGKSPVRSSVSLAFKPASVVRRTAATQVFQKQQETEPKKVRPVGGGLGYVAATEVKVTHVQQQKLQEKEADVEVEAAGGHFFQAMYRDEYQPARPNSYEAYCKEREDRKKMEQVKKELGRRQREQERESKLEREQLAKDLAEGRAPAMKLPAPAGRGRGMTMPAWMRKKIEENAAVAASQPEDERDVGREHENTSLKGQANFTEGQFEDAEEPRGLGFSTRGIGHTSSPGAVSLSRCLNGGHQDARDKTPSAPMLDEFGREVRQEPKRKHEDQRYDDRKLVSSSLDKRDNGRHETSESRPSTEKRRRTSGWDRRSPPTTSLTSRVVLLQNMVGPGEVDDELQDEVKGECSETYGPVTKCTIYEVTGRVSAEEAVRIFVQFKNAGDATKALTGLNGRFFGGRKVKAVYYDEGKFDQTDLTCQ